MGRLTEQVKGTTSVASDIKSPETLKINVCSITLINFPALFHLMEYLVYFNLKLLDRNEQ